MLTTTIKCPRCGAPINAWPRTRLEWSRGLRECHACGTWLEIANMHILAVLVGAVAGVCVGAAVYLFSDRWLWFVAASALIIPSMWWLTTVVQAQLGYWRIVPAPGQQSAAVKRWGRLIRIANFLAVLGIAVLIVPAIQLFLGRPRLPGILLHIGWALVFTGALLVVVAQVGKNRARAKELRSDAD